MTWGPESLNFWHLDREQTNPGRRPYRPLSEPAFMSFDELGLSKEVLRAVSDAGYTEPTPIQIQAIPVVFMGRDILGCA